MFCLFKPTDKINKEILAHLDLVLNRGVVFLVNTLEIRSTAGRSKSRANRRFGGGEGIGRL